MDSSGVTTNSGSLSGSSQTATLTVDSPAQNEEYTCGVKSGVFTGSEVSSKSVNLLVYRK